LNLTTLAEAQSRIDEHVAALMARDGSPGVALAITDRERAIVRREYGYANLAAREPISPATQFEFGSIGKAFTAVCLLQLADEGMLDLRAPVTTYLPWFDARSEYAPITLHDLLTHTSGLINGSDFALDAPYEVYALRQVGVSGPPGAHFHYSNVGYKALGLVLEAVVGKPYRTIVQERIFDPLGMIEAASAITSEGRRHLATGYWPRFDDRPARATDGVVEATWLETTTADGSLAASAGELCAFLRLLLNGGAGPRGPLISETSFDLMRQPHAEMRDGAHYGYALMLSTLDGAPTFGHSGGMPGFVSMMLGLPETGLGAVVLINGPGDPDAMARFALRAASAAIRGEAIPAPPPAPDPAAVENAADYAGTFTGRAGTLRLEPAGAGLDLVVGGERAPLLPRGTDAFLAVHPDFSRFLLRFERNEAGRVVAAMHGPDWFRGERHAGPTSFEEPGEWAALPGHYRSYNPWQSNFRIGLRQGQLWLFWPDGREERLQSTATGFQPTEDPNSPLRLTFDAIVGGQALRARWNSGDVYYRFFTP
jgi:D-alanyl-D-alanine carboxypeptidase